MMLETEGFSGQVDLDRSKVFTDDDGGGDRRYIMIK